LQCGARSVSEETETIRTSGSERKAVSEQMASARRVPGAAKNASPTKATTKVVIALMLLTSSPAIVLL
jgi:hypothetical protein